MDEYFSIGALIPLWILGSGWVLGIVQWVTRPTPAHGRDEDAITLRRDYATGPGRDASSASLEPVRQPI
jgi:hypothetical protein